MALYPDHDSTIELYSSDFSHPSFAGSYAAAATFYTLIFQKDPSLITDDAGLNPAVAQTIRNAAKVVAFDSLAQWNVGKFDPRADFSVQTNQMSILLQNNSLYADSYFWDLGDGDTSTLFEPQKTYQLTGSYAITLRASHCGLSDSTVRQVVIQAAALPSPQSEESILIKVLRHGHHIEISSGQNISSFRVSDLQGRILRAKAVKTRNGLLIEIPPGQKGIYLISVVSGRSLKTRKFVAE